MKRILLGVLTIVLTGSVVIGATKSFFSATGSVLGNSVATGTLLLDINKGAGKSITLSNIAPGYIDATYRWFDAYNKGTLPAEFFMKFTRTAGDQALYDALDIELKDGGWTGACDGPVFYTGKLSAFADNTKISDSNVHAASSVTDPVKDNIPADYTMRVCQKIELKDTGSEQNSLQGKSVTFTETINSMQDNNPDLLPSP